ncbi:MAG: hypothetical protein HRT71_05515 [Flavobacteriales bacterium]|nr:hypothetical protein [Flavobacteriales bacterium]
MGHQDTQNTCVHTVAHNGGYLQAPKIKSANKEIDTNKSRIAKLEEDYADGLISALDFNKMMKRFNDKIKDQTEVKKEIKNISTNYEQYADFSFDMVRNINILYEKAQTTGKQEIIGSIFPENLIYSKTGYRTTKLNKFILGVAPSTERLLKKETGRTDKNINSSRLVQGAGLEPLQITLNPPIQPSPTNLIRT